MPAQPPASQNPPLSPLAKWGSAPPQHLVLVGKCRGGAQPKIQWGFWDLLSPHVCSWTAFLRSKREIAFKTKVIGIDTFGNNNIIVH